MATNLSLPVLLAGYVLLLGICQRVDAYIYYPFAPNAHYQEGMNFSFFSGYKTTYAETAGYADKGTYNGVLSVAFERTEKFAFLTTGDGKKIRKINYRTSLVGPDITRKLCYLCFCNLCVLTTFHIIVTIYAFI